MGFYQQVKQGKMTAAEAIKLLEEKAKQNNELEFARKSKTMAKLKRMAGL